MPERHSTGSSGSSSSSSSSGHSNSGSSWSSGSSYRSYRSGRGSDDGPQSPEQQALNYVIGGIALVIIVGALIISALKNSNEKRSHADATATTQAITIADLKQMNDALKDRLPIWKKTTDFAVHRVSALDAGFGAGTNTKEVDYGYCEPGKFYVYVLELSYPGGYAVDTEGYVLSPDTPPRLCSPSGWSLVEVDDVGGGWYFITLNTVNATITAIATLSPHPTATPPVMTPSPQPDF